MRKRFWPLIFALFIPSLGTFALCQPIPAVEEEPDPQTQQAMEHFRQGVTAARDGAYEEAVQWFQAALQLKPEAAPSYLNLGYAYEKVGRLAEAEWAYREALRLQPNFPQAYLNLGNVLKATGRLAEAQQAFQEAIRLNPKFARAYNNLAWLWVSSRDPAFLHPREAEAHAKEAVRLTERTEAGPLDTLAEVQYALGRCFDAIQTEKEAIEEASDKTPYSKSLKRFELCLDAMRATRDGNLAKARQLWTEILALAPQDRRAREELARLQ